MKDELLHDLKKCIVNLKTKTDLLSQPKSDVLLSDGNDRSFDVGDRDGVSESFQVDNAENMLVDFSETANDTGHKNVDSSSKVLAPNQQAANDSNSNTNRASQYNTSFSSYQTKKHIIRDSESELRRLCVMIEKVFRRGLRQQNSVFGIVKRDYWSWIEYLAESKFNNNPHLSIIVNKIKNSGKFLTSQGRGRCFIRAALNKKILQVPIQLLYKSGEMLYSLYDPLTSLFTNEDSREFILGVFSLLGNMEFDLKIRNASFLDETWELPVFKQIELVPSDDLGLTIRFVQGRAVVVDLDVHGVAAEDDKVQVGDVIDEVHQISVYDSKPGTIHQILQDHAGWPITLGVIKPRSASYSTSTRVNTSGGSLAEKHTQFFQPIEKRLREVSVAYPKIKHLLESTDDDGSISAEDAIVCIEGKQYWRVIFIAKKEIGSQGGSQLIEPTVQSMLRERQKKNDTRILLAAYEADVTVLAAPISSFSEQSSQAESSSSPVGAGELSLLSSQPLWNHAFPEISSCGRRVDSPQCFMYIVGNDICNVATEFTAYLFEAPNGDISREILQNIAQGFKRTTWLT